MDDYINRETCKCVDSVISFVFDNNYEYKTDEYYNNQTNKCIVSMLNFVLREDDTLEIEKKSEIIKENNLSNETEEDYLSDETEEDYLSEETEKDYLSDETEEDYVSDEPEEDLSDETEEDLSYKNSSSNDQRPTFYTRSRKEIRGAGVLCYVRDKVRNKKYILLRESNGWISDMGGKTDIYDKSPLDTAIREVVEETNGHLFSSYHDSERCRFILNKHLPKRNVKRIYIRKSKYLLYIFEINYKNFGRSMLRFGKKEGNTNISHYYKWYESLPSRKLHPRLYNIRHELANLF
tara:strand:+ start:112 stop:990 length:879 start_codon:yes stop_codon:yes gene_type:complete